MSLFTQSISISGKVNGFCTHSGISVAANADTQCEQAISGHKDLSVSINLPINMNIFVLGSGQGFYSHMMSGRLCRLFTQFTVFQPSSAVLQAMYSKPIQSWLEQFPAYAVGYHVEFAEVTSNFSSYIDLH